MQGPPRAGRAPPARLGEEAAGKRYALATRALGAVGPAEEQWREEGRREACERP